MIGISPRGGAIGKRSLAFDPSGGNAVGVVGYVESMAATTVAGLAVHADGGATGVAYAGYQAPKDYGTTRMWIGRAAVSAPAGSGWSTVDATGLGYAWTQYDMSTHQPVAEAGSSGVPAFVQSMGGDGYGFYAVGFGCDGAAFNIDGWRIGQPGATATYDFEGYGSSTTISGPTDPVLPGRRVTLTGEATDDRGPFAGARSVLQAKQSDDTWETVAVATGAHLEATVRVTETTTYRWKVFSTPMVEGSASDPFTVRVAEPDEQPAEDPTAPPSDTPADTPTGTPSERPSEAPSAPAAPDAATTPVEAPAQEPAPAVETPTADTRTADPTPTEPPATEPPATEPPADEQTSAPVDATETPAG